MKYIKLFILAVLSAIYQPSTASHLGAGEITWECIKSGPNIGMFQFRVILNRDCNGIPGPDSLTLETNAPGFAGFGIVCNLVSQTDLSPVGPGCPTCANPMAMANAKEEFVYQSNPVLISGVPPASGWYFYYEDCCRNAAITNLAANGNGNFVLRAIMYPYNATNTNPCFDSSPQFAEKPVLGTCTQFTTVFNHNAFDPELDSIIYEWDNPLQGGFPPGPGTPYPFNSGYSAISPLPGPAQNPNNQAAVLNSANGTVSFLSFTPGAFVTVTKVTAWKCGYKVAEVFRESQIAILNNCIISNPPGGPAVYNTPPAVADLTGNPLTSVFDTVYAGEIVDITLIANDFEMNQMGGPQSLTLSPSGMEFGTNFTNAGSGCPFPPCATLDPPYVDTIPPINPIFYPLTIQTRFLWATDCSHLVDPAGCSSASRTFNFVLKVADNFCPAPGVNPVIISITVLAPDNTISGPTNVTTNQPYTYSVPFDSNATSYSWFTSCGTILSGQGTSSISVQWNNAPSCTILSIVNYQNCSDTTSMTVYPQTTSLEGQSADEPVEIYPNPVEDELNIKFPNPTSTFKIEVLDVQNRLLNSMVRRDESLLKVNTADFSPGVYFLKISGGDSIMVHRFIRK